jgi:hypothetical protein
MFKIFNNSAAWILANQNGEQPRQKEHESTTHVVDAWICVDGKQHCRKSGLTLTSLGFWQVENAGSAEEPSHLTVPEKG